MYLLYNLKRHFQWLKKVKKKTILNYICHSGWIIICVEKNKVVRHYGEILYHVNTPTHYGIYLTVMVADNWLAIGYKKKNSITYPLCKVQFESMVCRTGIRKIPAALKFATYS